MSANFLWILSLLCLVHKLHALMDLTQPTFKSSLQALPPNQVVLMEFYASWCPACRGFAPHYEKIAAYFESPPYTDPKVVVARADCATEVALCGRFKIHGYPSIMLGLSTDFSEDKLDKLKHFQGATRTPTSVVAWIAEQLNAQFKYEERKPSEASASSGAESAGGASSGSALATTPATISQPQEFSIADTEMATIELFSEATLSLRSSETRTALIHLLSLFAEAHASPNCMAGANSLLSSIDTLWPTTSEEPTPELLRYPICGKEHATQWVVCDDNGTNTRGFTCGLWILLHSLTTRLPEDKPSEHIMTGVSAFVNHFFKCTLCAKHFKTLLEREDAKAIRSKRDAVLWLWKMHNIVNARLAAESAAEGTAATSPTPVKFQWPAEVQCPSCRLPNLEKDDKNVKWSEDEVYAFLLRFYGGPVSKLGSGTSVTVTGPSIETTAGATTAKGSGTATGGASIGSQAEVQAQAGGVGMKTRKELYEKHATASQFTTTTFVFLVLLLGVWYTAARVFHKHRHNSRRLFGYDR